MKKLIVFAILLLVPVLGATSLYAWLASGESSELRYRTTPVRRADMLITVGATGTIEPEEVVDIGAQVVGRIKELGLDPRGKTEPKFETKTLDYGSPVEQGMLLARIDPAIYQAQADQAKAALALATANVAQMEAKLLQTEAEWDRAGRLKELRLTSHSPTGKGSTQNALPIKGISDADYILAKANFKSAEASLEASKATVKQQEAALLLAETNLGYTSIVSPVDGTIIDRRVNVGQTVVASLNAPSLFLLARDLRRMQVWALVNEADIGRLNVGTEVNFHVDTFPGDEFRGVVEQIRLNAQMTQNVVIYTVVITVDNSEMKLLPYLTANVKFEIDKRVDALTVANAALRYQPKPEQVAEDVQPAHESEPSPGALPTKGNGKKQFATLWTMQPETGLLVPIQVRTGISDGVVTEIFCDDLEEGTEIVLGEVRGPAPTEVVTNPFAPPTRFGKGGNRPQGGKGG